MKVPLSRSNALASLLKSTFYLGSFAPDLCNFRNYYSSSTVVESFIDLLTPNVLVFMIASYNILQFGCCQCSHTNFTSSLESCQLHSNSKAPF